LFSQYFVSIYFTSILFFSRKYSLKVMNLLNIIYMAE